MYLFFTAKDVAPIESGYAMGPHSIPVEKCDEAIEIMDEDEVALPTHREVNISSREE